MCESLPTLRIQAGGEEATKRRAERRLHCWARCSGTECRFAGAQRGWIADRHAVVSSGIYRYIRHPIYTGDILLLLGLELCLNSWLVLGLALLVPAVAVQAIKEEQKLVDALPDYASYIRRTKRFIPFLV